VTDELGLQSPLRACVNYGEWDFFLEHPQKPDHLLTRTKVPFSFYLASPCSTVLAISGRSGGLGGSAFDFGSGYPGSVCAPFWVLSLSGFRINK